MSSSWQEFLLQTALVSPVAVWFSRKGICPGATKGTFMMDYINGWMDGWRGGGGMGGGMGTSPWLVVALLVVSLNRRSGK